MKSGVTPNIWGPLGSPEGPHTGKFGVTLIYPWIYLGDVSLWLFGRILPCVVVIFIIGVVASIQAENGAPFCFLGWCGARVSPSVLPRTPGRIPELHLLTNPVRYVPLNLS